MFARPRSTYHSSVPEAGAVSGSWSACARAPPGASSNSTRAIQTARVVLCGNFPLRRLDRSRGLVDGFDSDVPQEREPSPNVHCPPPSHWPGRVRDVPQPLDARPFAEADEADPTGRDVAKPDVAIQLAAEQRAASEEAPARVLAARELERAEVAGE